MNEQQVAYSTFKAAVQSCGSVVFWQVQPYGYNLYTEAGRFFLMSQTASEEDVQDFEATLKDQTREVTSRSDAVVLATVLTGQWDQTVVNTFSGPNPYFAWTESLYGHVARDGSDAELVTVPHPMTGTPTQYHKKSVSKVLTKEFGFQNIIACWARCNEGDYVDVFVDVPELVNGVPTGNWITANQFAEAVTLFDSNPEGTVYPPDVSPAMSWIPAGCRIRFDFYKLAVNDPDLATARGPFIDLDLIGQRKRG